ncbi:hypothetical protein E2C01_056796 [Portunus trituberculatus]|uniref:Uncharacterized protein n=1 Tax=Portunus trituberculatus TaxID=210409 RepID=A0A5B7H047_PORTR|nr:hypothetical protein [Portunus trituberculatus]
MDEKRNFEKVIMEKCKDQPKFVNGKLKEKQQFKKSKVNGTTFHDPKEQAEIMNHCFEGFFYKSGTKRKEES